MLPPGTTTSDAFSRTLSTTERRRPNSAMSDAPPSEPRDTPKGAVVVVGSANVDLVMNPRDLPSPGVTVLAPSYKLLPGGKGANQAYACAKLGCESVRFIGATGDDDFSKLVLGNLEAAGVDVTGVAKRADLPTACASVVVDARGENQICVGSGANAAVAADQLDGRIARGDVLLMQMEAPTPTLEACVAKAKACGAAVAVNVAPSANASAVGVDVYRAVDFLIVNQHELEDVCDAVRGHFGQGEPRGEGPASSASSADLAVFVARTTETIVVVTYGAAGAKLFLPRRPAGAPARVPHRADVPETDVITVDAAPLRDGEAIVDTVGAGDAFVGAFVARVARGDSLIRCAAIAAAAGTMACTREGAQGGTHGAADVEERSRSVGMSADWGKESEPAFEHLQAPAVDWI